MDVVVGRVGRAHGIKGDVVVELRTDEPDRRFAVGAVLAGDPWPTPLTVGRARWHADRFLVTFDEVRDRTQAERLRGVELLAAVDPDERPDDPNEFYDRHLAGLAVVDTAGAPLGVVDRLLHGPQDLLVVSMDGAEVLVPFVAAIVTDVDLEGGTVVVDPPGGLFPERG